MLKYRSNKFHVDETMLFVGVNSAVNPIVVIRDSRVDSRVIRRRTANSPARDAGQNESVDVPLFVVFDGHERAAAVALTTVDSTGHVSRAQHIFRHES